MTKLERTRQQLDPVGALPARLVTIALAAGSFAYGSAMMIRTSDVIVNPALAVLALVWLAAAATVVGVASSPRWAPFTFSTHVIVQLLALGSIVLAVASQWGSARYVQNGFGPVSLGVLILAMGVYRPARELATVGTLAAVFVGFVTLLRVPNLATDSPAAAYVLVAMAPILAFTFGSAMFSSRLVDELERLQRAATRSMEAITSKYTDGISKSVRAERLRILDQDVFPFFRTILSQDTVSDANRVQAREIAESIREVMVAEADRTWLEVVAGEDGVPPEGLKQTVVDQAGRATGMSAEQRTVLRALIVAVLECKEFESGSLKIVITGLKKRSAATLTARIRNASDKTHTGFGPYFAVMRIVFTDLTISYQNSKLTVKFSYEQR